MSNGPCVFAMFEEPVKREEEQRRGMKRQVQEAESLGKVAKIATLANSLCVFAIFATAGRVLDPRPSNSTANKNENEPPGLLRPRISTASRPHRGGRRGPYPS